MSHGGKEFWHSAAKQQHSLFGPSVEQVQRRDGGLFGFLNLRFGQFDPAHGDDSTDGKVSRNAANTQPERPVQAVVQDGEHKEALAIVGHPLAHAVVPHGRQEAQQGQGAEKSWTQRGGTSQGRRLER